ncbi:MAG: DUF4007 family protein [Bacteroidales bacterium]|nr:DUF4007 family protein [Bacteroidales bacterium]
MTDTQVTKYCFSGHESFPCKTLWLKKGYDFVSAGLDFNAPDAVVHLGVGKNMVASIRYWMRAFGILDSSELTSLAHYIFDDTSGCDRYLEDIASLQLLHFVLVNNGEASIYRMLFCGLQRERNTFDREQVLNYVSLKMAEAGKQKLFNANTVKKDIAVLLQNYCLPRKPQGNEDFSSLMIDLDFIRQNSEDGNYYFNTEGKRPIISDVFLCALLMLRTETGDSSIPFDTIQSRIGLTYCMTDSETTSMLRGLSTDYPDLLSYNDVAGVRQIQLVGDIDYYKVLDNYYGK